LIVLSNNTVLYYFILSVCSWSSNHNQRNQDVMKLTSCASLVRLLRIFILFFWLSDKLHFILSYEANHPQSPTILSFAELQYLQQCQVNFHSIFTPGFWSKWMVPEKWSPQCGFEPMTFQSWVFCLKPLDHGYSPRLILIWIMPNTNIN